MEMKDLFVETKKVIAAYKAKAEALDQQEQELKLELAALQTEMTAILLDQEGASLSDRIYLKAQAKGVNNKTDIINTMLEELDEGRTALKLQFAPIYNQALRTDMANRENTNATEIMERYRYIMLKEISDIGKDMGQQYYSIAEDIYELFEDPKVNEALPHVKRVFNRDLYSPTFSFPHETILSKSDIYQARQGKAPQLPKHMTTNKDVE